MSEQARLNDIFAALSVTAPTALDRAAGLYEAKRIYEALNPRARRGGDRRSTAFRGRDQSENISFRSHAAARLGLTPRAVELDIELAADLGDALIAELRGNAVVADNFARLRFIADLDDAGRRKLLARLATAKFNDALIDLGLRRELDAQEALFQSIAGRLENASARTLRRLRDLIDRKLTSGRGTRTNTAA
ncbi:MAG: hypothetical protein GEU91_14000 [Rhizobiales bacterium]|nr:hypothetical protein [Hyphomicrobiales bacterium]